MAKGDDSWGLFALLLFIILIIGAAASNSSPSQPTVSPNPQTWQQYAQNPSNDDVLAQLANSQKLVVALGNDISHLESQNVDIQNALATVNRQLSLAQQQAKEDGKRQRIEQWITTIVGTIGGWLLGIVAPAQQTLSKFWGFIKGLFTGNIKRSKKETKKAAETPLREHIQTDSIATNHSNDSSQKLPQAVQAQPAKLCPTCGSPMKIQIATKGEHKGKRFFVCPNYQQCQQFCPVD